MARAKIQDVARLAGVSLSTVSAVLNAKDVVSDATKQRVLQAIENLQYSPDLYASNLARRQMRVIGVIVSDLQNPFFAETAQSIEDEARRVGYQISLAASNFSPQILRSIVRQMLGARISGLAVMTSEQDEEAFEVIHASGIASVFLDVGRPGPAATNIRVDTRGGMMASVKHLLDLGHRDLLLVRNSENPTGAPLLSHTYRDEGFHAAVGACGMANLRTNIVDAPGTGADAGYRAITTALGTVPFTAVIAVTDMVALGVYRGLQERGIAIPDEVSVVGFDNTYFSRFLTPSLSTVDISRSELSQMAVAALTQAEPSPASAKDLKLATRLILRESTGAPKRAPRVPGTQR